MRPRAALASSLIVAILASSAPALAQDDDAASERARTYFREGLAYADEGEWDHAVERFRAALEIRNAANIRFNLAQSLVEMGRLVEALAELATVIADPEATDDVREAGTRLRDSLTPRLGTLVVRVRGERTGVQVTIDGRPLRAEELGGPVPADPGVRIARLLRGASELDVEEVDVPSGESARVLLEAPTLPLSAQPVLQPQQHWDDAWTWTIVLVSVLVVAGTAVGIGIAITDQVNATSAGDFGPPVLGID